MSDGISVGGDYSKKVFFVVTITGILCQKHTISECWGSFDLTWPNLS